MPDYLYLIHPFRQEFFSEPTPAEDQVMEDHYQYVKHAIQEGKAWLAGPCLDDTFGLVIFNAADDQEAQRFMMEDPSVKSNVMLAELHPFKLSLLKGG